MPEPKSETRRGNTFIRKNGDLYVLCKDNMFRRVIQDKLKKGVVVIDESHNVFYNPVNLYEDL